MKKFAYQVTSSTYPQVKVGSVLLYDRGRGPTHFETIFNTKTIEEVGSFLMKKVGPCWVVDGKVQFEKPPAKSGEITKQTMAACRKRARELALLQKKQFARRRKSKSSH